MQTVQGGVPPWADGLHRALGQFGRHGVQDRTAAWILKNAADTTWAEVCSPNQLCPALHSISLHITEEWVVMVKGLKLVVAFYSLEANSTSSPGSEAISLGLCTGRSTLVYRNTVEVSRDRIILKSVTPGVLSYCLFSNSQESWSGWECKMGCEIREPPVRLRMWVHQWTGCTRLLSVDANWHRTACVHSTKLQLFSVRQLPESKPWALSSCHISHKCDFSLTTNSYCILGLIPDLEVFPWVQKVFSQTLYNLVNYIPVLVLVNVYSFTVYKWKCSEEGTSINLASGCFTARCFLPCNICMKLCSLQ